MTSPYERIVRPFLFEYDSEQIHDFTLNSLNFASRNTMLREATASLFKANALPVEVFGLRFPNPIGLAAGMDKRGAAVPIWEALGFGFSELGGITCHEQPGNPKPRMFRAVEDRALVNRMGFNNPGCDAMAANLQSWKESGNWPNHPVGINLGKSKITELKDAPQDYLRSFRTLRDYADFFVVNVSSPNTPGLRKLQDKSALTDILNALHEENLNGHSRPILVKVAPDLTFDALDDLMAIFDRRKVAGVVATNTTIERPTTNDPAMQRTYDETGGLSGAPLRHQATQMIRHLYRHTNGEFPIIGVGGIFDGADAWEKITAGASLVQIYTGLVYRGPGVVKEIVTDLAEQMSRHGMGSISEAVGTKA
ncbi:MAG: dihydroorotate dehydrogenase (quinone) [Verrucomicrobiales bacterium]|nr:dihydroorotate dehydrogenase (quinone) [Verrucomicrobiales bacterium]|tara:strand:- start:853 stop:1950 length:1098 start_codon:yes stop_codon:yes gene_type:complete